MSIYSWLNSLVHRFIKSRRGVSPVVAIVLLIAIGIAGGAGVSVILSNVTDDPLTVESKIIASQSESSNDLDVSISSLSTDFSLILSNVTDYTSIAIMVQNNAGSDVYIIDFDILVYGEKLDDYSPWTITDASGATYTSSEGNYAGYKQNSDTSAIYTVEVEDVNNTLARLPNDTTFTYQVKYGDEPGVISKFSYEQRESKVIFEVIFFNVAIFHWGSTFAVSSAAGQYEQTLTSLNGTNKMFFRYSRGDDAFDVSDSSVVSSLNITQMSLFYDLVLVDKWVVPQGAGDVIEQLHVKGTDLIFYGGLVEFDQNLQNVNTIYGMIDLPRTLNITGLVPDFYFGGGVKGSVNGYRFYSGSDSVLAGHNGESFDEIPNNNANKVKGDLKAVDAADLGVITGAFDILGNATYKLYKKDLPNQIVPANLLWENNGPLLIRKNKVINESGLVYSFVWKHNEIIKDNKATKTNPAHLASIRKAMILSTLGESVRELYTYAELSIDAITLDVQNPMNTKFDVQITATVLNADINGGTLYVTLYLPDLYDWKTTIGNFNAYVDGNLVINKKNYVINPDGRVYLDIGGNYTQTLVKGSTIIIVLQEKFGDGKWMDLNTADTTAYDWMVDASFESGTFALPGYANYIQSVAVDNSVW